MPKNNRDQKNEHLDSELLSDLEGQISSLQNKLQTLEKNGRLDTYELSEMESVSRDVEYRTGVVDRLYKKKGVAYSLAVKMPLKILNVGSLSDSQKFMRDSFRGMTSPMCVICHKGILMHNPNQIPVNGQVLWFCSNQGCSFQVLATPANKDLLMLDVRQKINDDIHVVGQNRWSELSEDQKEDLIKGHLSKANMLRWVAVALSALTLFEIIMGYWWALLMIIPVLLLSWTLSVKWCYRAWQIKTGNLFLPNSMFIDWLKTAEAYYSVDWVDQEDQEGEGDD